MLKTEIFAAGIQNLSDARYFAAWGVKYMSFPIMDATQLPTIKEMIDWVEGPEMVGELVALDITENLAEGIKDLEVNHLMIAPFYEGFQPPGYQYIYQTIGASEISGLSDVSVIKYETAFANLGVDDFDKINAIAKEVEVFIDLPFTAANVPSILDRLPGVGLVLRGGEEEKVGVKSFEDLDDIIEQLEEY